MMEIISLGGKTGVFLEEARYDDLLETIRILQDIIPKTKKNLEWYLEDYDDESGRFDWGDGDKAEGRELL